MEKMLLSAVASLFGVVVALCVYVWTRTISEYDKINTEHSADIKVLKDRMTAIETKHEDKMCERGKK
jgi:nitrogen fixation-related uncharacterized protein